MVKWDLWSTDESVTNNEYKERLKSTVTGFLDGKWLEVYVYNVITQGIRNDNKLKALYEKGEIEVADNWKIRKKGSGKDFELDVILLNGYQVCGISCTTILGMAYVKARALRSCIEQDK